MVIKLCANGCETYIEAETIQAQRLESGCIDVQSYKAGVLQSRNIIGDHETATHQRAYVMENGKTVDTIRA